MTTCDGLGAGQVGYFMAQIKTHSSDVHIGDTVTDALPAADGGTPLPGYKEPKPMVLQRASIPVNNNDFETLREALGKLQAQRFQLHVSTRSQRGPRASAFAAAFWACSTVRSSSNGWSATAT